MQKHSPANAFTLIYNISTPSKSKEGEDSKLANSAGVRLLYNLNNTQKAQHKYIHSHTVIASTLYEVG